MRKHGARAAVYKHHFFGVQVQVRLNNLSYIYSYNVIFCSSEVRILTPPHNKNEFSNFKNRNKMPTKKGNKEKKERKARSAIPKPRKTDLIHVRAQAFTDEAGNAIEVPREPQIKRTPMRVDRNTTLYVRADISEQAQRRRYEDFCIANKLGDYRTFMAARGIKASKTNIVEL